MWSLLGGWTSRECASPGAITYWGGDEGSKISKSMVSLRYSLSMCWWFCTMANLFFHPLCRDINFELSRCNAQIRRSAEITTQWEYKFCLAAVYLKISDLGIKPVDPLSRGHGDGIFRYGRNVFFRVHCFIVSELRCIWWGQKCPPAAGKMLKGHFIIHATFHFRRNNFHYSFTEKVEHVIVNTFSVSTFTMSVTYNVVDVHLS